MWLERHSGGQYFVEADVISKVRSFSLNSLFLVCDFGGKPTKNFQNDKTFVRKLFDVNIRLGIFGEIWHHPLLLPGIWWVSYTGNNIIINEVSLYE